MHENYMDSNSNIKCTYIVKFKSSHSKNNNIIFIFMF